MGHMQFFGRVVGMGLDTARHYGSLVARAQKNGFNVHAMDALIAATAVANGMTVATLNRKDFEPLGVELVEF
jgi:predicted nucleic acid-binding protein